MENEPKFTKAPWAWQKFGNDYCLTGQYGMRPIVLSVGGKPRGLQLLNSKTGLLVPFTPLHPDATLIAAAPELYATCQFAKKFVEEKMDPTPMDSFERQLFWNMTMALAAAQGAR